MIENIKLLENDFLKLERLQIAHYKELWPIAQQIDLYQYSSSDVSTLENLKAYLTSALLDKNAVAFIIYDKRINTYVGSTRFGNIDLKNKVLHIGWTWISTETQGTGLNHSMKFLMLRYVFEELNFEKVEFRIDERNIKSRKAIEKLGATLEGVLRKNVTTKNNFRRSSCCYGILKEEWSSLKESHFNT
ncbi:GNAT family N-acetyltransferase [Cellulophaga sp. F20128]|uniref:GNAT family N-acetyltransferase n=1 Tax=Cellulophaga sp. F20128 TaxID=2926413 RepID=UPI001FF129BD|nr:GNAT family protein [Cellulophaga sp. F20128]MCK0156628.1 GNAT family N-acetyltransferase [Cellulophaga sp. F20128]